MDANAIIEKIHSDASHASATLLAEAKKKVSEVQEQTQTRIAKQKQDAIERATNDGILMRDRMLRMAELENKKALLTKKRQIMDDVFAKALDKLEDEPKENLEQFFLSLVISVANGDETFLVGDKNASWYSDSFLEKANVALKKEGKTGGLTKGNDAISGVGFALQKDGTKINCTMRDLLHQSRMRLETEVAQILFR